LSLGGIRCRAHRDSAEDEAEDEEDAGDDPGDLLVLVISLEAQTLLVLLSAGQRNDEVDEVPDAETAEGDEFEDAGADLAQVEAVDAESAEQPRQQPRSEERFLPDEGLELPE
jgi:hypothetical protein